MKTIDEKAQIQRYQNLVSEMTEGRVEFSPQWVKRSGWKVVPAESGARLSPEDIPRIVSVLKAAGYQECLAVTTEDLGDFPPCYIVSVDGTDFKELNRVLGPFRFLLTDEARSWAISCNEWYNLFAGPGHLVEALLGIPIAEARRVFLRFAEALSKGDPEYPLLKVAQRYGLYGS
jgi:hypothetical protein